MTTGSDWLDQARRLVDTFLTGAGAAGAGDVHGDTCRWCPLCQAAAVARGERPEMSAALADVLTATAGALRAFAEGAERPGPDARPDEAHDETPEAAPEPAVQRIDIA